MPLFRSLSSAWRACSGRGVLWLALSTLLPGASLAATTALPVAADTQTTHDSAMADRMLACTACHGAEGRAGADGYYPRIAGKPTGYLYQQLLNFRDGRRLYEPMKVMLQQLPERYLHDIAQYFSAQHPPYPLPERTPTTAAQLQRGEHLVYQGDTARGLPACVACHGQDLAGSEPGIPGLLGLSRDYLTAQLGAWQNGTRRTPAPDCMATLMQKLPPTDLAAVATWLSYQPVPADYRPAAHGPATLPLACHAIALPGGTP